MRQRLEKAGYVEVKTLQLVDRLFGEIRHWEKFREHMFIAEVDEGGKGIAKINALWRSNP